MTTVILGAAKLHQLENNLGAANVKLTREDIAALDAATALAPVYPNWFIERLADGPIAQAVAPPTTTSA